VPVPKSTFRTEKTEKKYVTHVGKILDSVAYETAVGVGGSKIASPGRSDSPVVRFESVVETR